MEVAALSVDVEGGGGMAMFHGSMDGKPADRVLKTLQQDGYCSVSADINSMYLNSLEQIVGYLVINPMYLNSWEIWSLAWLLDGRFMHDECSMVGPWNIPLHGHRPP
jgi:hypothetical protein